MQTLDRDTQIGPAYGATAGSHSSASTTQDLINFHHGTRQIEWRFDLLHADKSYKSDITPYVTNFSVAHDTTRPIHRTCTLDMLETVASQTATVSGSTITDIGIDYESDLIRPVCLIGYFPGSGEWLAFDLGIFKFQAPSVTMAGYAVVRHAECPDLSYIVQQNQSVTGSDALPLTIPAGAYVIDVIKDLLTNATTDPTLPGCGISTGWIGSDWPSHTTIDATFSTDRQFSEGTSYLDIINQLLFYVSCYDLWVDEGGIFHVTQWPPGQDYRSLSSSYTYDTTVDSIVGIGGTETFRLDQLANVVNVMVEDAARATFYATARIDAAAAGRTPSSPIDVSQPNMGRKVKVITDSGIPEASSQNWAQQYAVQQLIMAAWLTDEVVLPTAVNPAHQDHDVVTLHIAQTYNQAGTPVSQPIIVSGSLPGIVVTEKFLETGWEIQATLPAPGGSRAPAGNGGVTTTLAPRDQMGSYTMSHTLHRVTSLADRADIVVS